MSRALRPALTLCACIATVGLSACSAASTDGSGDSASSDAHGLTSTQSGAPTAQSGSSGGLYETGYLQLGQCLLTAPQADVPLELVDCAQEHGAEVIHTFDLTATTMPSEDTLDEVSDEACGEAFTAYVGRPFENSALDYIWRLPSPETWAAGDRRVECIAFTRDESQLTTTMKDTNM